MKTKVVMLAMIFFMASAQCQAKKLRRKTTMTITPQMAVEAAVELFTCSPAKPVVERVQIKEVNGRKKLVPVKQNKDFNSKRP